MRIEAKHQNLFYVHIPCIYVITNSSRETQKSQEIANHITIFIHLFSLPAHVFFTGKKVKILKKSNIIYNQGGGESESVSDFLRTYIRRSHSYFIQVLSSVLFDF